MPRDNKTYSGFLHHDYILTFDIERPETRAKLIMMCRDPWQGDAITSSTWEVSNNLSPDEMEKAILSILDQGDRVIYYYRSKGRVFRVVLEG